MAKAPQRVHDAGSQWSADTTHAIRGMAEELASRIEPDELTWLSFGPTRTCASTDSSGGWTRTGPPAGSTLADRRERQRTTGRPSTYTPSHSRRSMSLGSWPIAVEPSHLRLVAIMHALMHEFGIRDRSRLRGHHSVVSQHLPPWLDSGSQRCVEHRGGVSARLRCPARRAASARPGSCGSIQQGVATPYQRVERSSGPPIRADERCKATAAAACYNFLYKIEPAHPPFSEFGASL